MVYLVAIALAFAIGLTVLLLAELLPAKPRALEQRLADIQTMGLDPHAILFRRRRQQQRERVLELLQEIGGRLSATEASGQYRKLLMHAGYRYGNAIAVFWGLRIVLAAGLFALVMLISPLMRLSTPITMLAGIYFAGLGWVVPVLVLRSKKNARQKEITKALPDALDLLVVCVEAGLGLNQALVRVADEIKHVSQVLSFELAMVNVEIRAGAPREEALRNLAERTGVDDLRTLVTILIQTDRFGTSVARSLRVHADILREKRRQRAEEAAAKTAIKMVFPLVLCIFPAMFVVIIGASLIQIFRVLSTGVI
ncbi:MAG: type II secretion system F family protein [Longimicrobiales bacterium]